VKTGGLSVVRNCSVASGNIAARNRAAVRNRAAALEGWQTCERPEWRGDDYRGSSELWHPPHIVARRAKEKEPSRSCRSGVGPKPIRLGEMFALPAPTQKPRLEAGASDALTPEGSRPRRR
jgi:hypothetical protein